MVRDSYPGLRNLPRRCSTWNIFAASCEVAGDWEGMRRLEFSRPDENEPPEGVRDRDRLLPFPA